MIRTTDRSRRVRLLLALLLTASLVVITIDFRSKDDGVLDAIGRGLMTVLAPVQKGIASVARPVGDFFTGFTKVPSLRERISVLEAENAELRALQEQVSDIVRENERLRSLLELRARLQLRSMTAQVIGVGSSNFRRTLILDRGTRDGVRKDMPVIGGTGLVGRVIQAGPSTAQVVLITDRSASVAARLAAGGETGIVSGTGGSLLRFELLDAEAGVKVGDQVVTSGYDGGLYPAGIPIGTVAEIPEARPGLSKIVTVRPFVDFGTLDYVLLVTGEEPGRVQPSPDPVPSDSPVPEATP